MRYQVLGQDLGKARHVIDEFFRVEDGELASWLRQRLDDFRLHSPQPGVEGAEQACRAGADYRQVVDFRVDHLEDHAFLLSILLLIIGSQLRREMPIPSNATVSLGILHCVCEMNLQLPFQPPIQHMLAKAVDAIPTGPGWLYEPKWDGFRTLVFFDGDTAYLQSRDLKPLGRYFPELVESLKHALPGPCVVDGETVIVTGSGL